MKNKYEFTEEHYTTEDGHTLHRIRALRDFSNVKKGDLGGFIESEKNLSQSGSCWIDNTSEVYGNARIRDNAIVKNDSSISGNSEVFENAVVCGTVVENNSKIYGYSQLYECIVGTQDGPNKSATIDISGNCHILRSNIGRAKIYGYAYIEDSNILGNSEVFDHSIVINGTVESSSVVCEGAFVNNYSIVSHNSEVKGRAEVNNSTISNCRIFDHAYVERCELMNQRVLCCNDMLIGCFEH